MPRLNRTAPDLRKDARLSRAKPARWLRPCNLCGERFKALTAHCCFCESCKKHHDLYRFHDWLPEELAVA